VQAAAHGKEIVQAPRCFLIRQLVKGNQGKGFRTESGRVLQTHVPLQLGFFSIAVVPLFAGYLARTATDTFSNVNQR
jgi:hypothetical protein